MTRGSALVCEMARGRALVCWRAPVPAHSSPELSGVGGFSGVGGSVPLQRLGRLEFYATCREPDLAVCVATGDNRLYANILLTVGYIPPSP